jgi:hypothetical protein
VTVSASYDVRIWKVEKRDRAQATYHRLRWSVAGKVFSEHFTTAKLADSFRATLLRAAREGEPFDRATGRPVSMRASRVETSWVQLAHEFIDTKWAEVSARHRRSTVEGLVTLTCALVRDGRTPPDAGLLREALTHWEFNTAARAGAAEPPDRYCEGLRWIDANSLPLDHLASGDGVRVFLPRHSVGALDRLGVHDAGREE